MNNGETKVPFAGAGDGRHRRQSINVDATHRGRQQAIHPAGGDIAFKAAAGGHFHIVEPQRLIVGLSHAKHRFIGVFEEEALGRRQRKAQTRMREFATADIAFHRIVAKSDAIDRRQIAVAVTLSDSRRANLPSRRDSA